MSKKDTGKGKGHTRYSPAERARLEDRDTGDMFKQARAPVSDRQYLGEKSILARRTIDTPDKYEPGIKKLCGDLPF